MPRMCDASIYICFLVTYSSKVHFVMPNAYIRCSFVLIFLPNAVGCRLAYIRYTLLYDALLVNVKGYRLTTTGELVVVSYSYSCKRICLVIYESP